MRLHFNFKTFARASIVNQIKIDGGILRAFFAYWWKKPLKEWPEYFKKLIAMAKREGHEHYLKTTNGKYAANGLIEYCLSKYYYWDEESQSRSLNPFEDPSNFYITYILEGYKLIGRKFYKKFIKDKTPEEVTNLVYSIPVLNKIFSALKVI